MSTMMAVVMHEHGDRDVLQLEQVPIPQPAADEVRIKVQACALNWLDVGVRRGALFGALPLPLTTGCDTSGVVDAVGDQVGDWQVGDEVTLYGLVTCRDCEFCRAGRHHHLPASPDHRRAYQWRPGGIHGGAGAQSHPQTAEPESY